LTHSEASPHRFVLWKKKLQGHVTEEYLLAFVYVVATEAVSDEARLAHAAEGAFGIETRRIRVTGVAKVRSDCFMTFVDICSHLGYSTNQW
jgi:hypothetical protein